jgi:hypothetical protein
VRSREAARDIAGTMRRALGAQSVLLGMEDGDVAGEQLGRLAAEVFELAEGGMLSLKAVQSLAKFAPKRPRVARWVAMLRRLYAAQEGAQ